jgi:hypothetical protein
MGWGIGFEWAGIAKGKSPWWVIGTQLWCLEGRSGHDHVGDQRSGYDHQGEWSEKRREPRKEFESTSVFQRWVEERGPQEGVNRLHLVLGSVFNTQPIL